MKNSERVALGVALLFLMLAMLLGGGTRQALLADVALQLVALPVIVFACWRLFDVTLERRTQLLLCTALALLWLALQLLPLSPTLWAMLPGRALLTAELHHVGIEPTWRAISVDTLASTRALLAWLPPVAIGLLTVTLDSTARRRMLQAIIVLALLSILFGMAQLAGGEHSPLRWHAITNTTQAVGPFANRNHLASLIVLALPLAVASLIEAARQSVRPELQGRRTAHMALSTIALVLLLIGLVVTRSRAGAVLGAVAVLLSVVLVWRRTAQLEHVANRQRVRHWLALAGLAGLVFSIQYGFVGLLARFDANGVEDARWNITATTVQAARHFTPVGVGAGNFGAVYPSFEPTAQRGIYYVNRAHNDWAEWWLEGGVPLILLALIGVVLLFAATISAWRAEDDERLWRLSAALACWLVLLHSAMDYPLRTSAIASVFAALLAVAFAPANAPPTSNLRLRRRTRNIADM